jgi:hypothetical protein
VVLGCAVSLMTSGRLSLRLALPAAIYWSIAPLLQIAGLAAVWPWKRRELSFARGIDGFFASQTLWSFWLCGFAGVWAFFPAARVFSWTDNPWFWYIPALVVAFCTAWLDYRFFRTVAGRTPARAFRDLAIERAIVWPLLVVVFMGSGAWQVVASRFGL